MAFGSISIQNSKFGQPSATGGGTTLPSQTGYSGKFLTTNGSATSWAKPFNSDTAIGIGTATQSTGTGSYPVAVGYAAGYQYQNNYAIAIGYGAGYYNQPSNSIILNASGSTLSGDTSYSFYVNPVRNDTVNKTYAVYYNPSTYEVTYDTASGGGGGASALSGLSDVSISGTPTTGYVLKYDGSAWSPAADVGKTALSQLTDVSISGTPTTGYVLKYNGTAWAPAADSTGSGGGSSYTEVVAGDYYLAIDSSGGWQEGVLVPTSSSLSDSSYSYLVFDVTAATTTASGMIGGANYNYASTTYIYFYNSRISTSGSTSVTVPSGAISMTAGYGADFTVNSQSMSYPLLYLQIILNPSGQTKVGGSLPRTL